MAVAFDPDELAVPWRRFLSESERDGWEAQLRREIAPGHALYGMGLRALGRRDDRDDVLVSVDGLGWAIVHLTWQRHAPADPHWPNSWLIESTSELLDRLARDEQEFS